VATSLDFNSDAGGSAKAPGGFSELSTGLGMKKDFVGEESRVE
jgi:hypothetical protein